MIIDPDQIKDDHARRGLELASEYKRRVDEIISQQPELLRQRLETTQVNVERWFAAIVQLVQAIDKMESNTTVSRDKVALPREIERLKVQEKRERNAKKKQKLTTDIASRENLLKDLGSILEGIEESHRRLDETLNQLKNVLDSLERLSQRLINRSATDDPA